SVAFDRRERIAHAGDADGIGMSAEDERPPFRASFEHGDDVRPAGRDDADRDVEADAAHVRGDGVRDLLFAGGAGHQRWIHRIDRDEIAKQTDGWIHERVAYIVAISYQPSAMIAEREALAERTTMIPAPLDRAKEIALAVGRAGGRALIVGGWVRDRLLGITSAIENIDLEVFGVASDRLRRLLETFGRVEAVGESFQVYKVGDIDVSLPRRDSKAGRGHRGFVVVGDPDMSIEDAARRRDFTVNAISWDPLTDDYFDPFDGR